MKEHIWKPADGVYDGWCIQITQQNEPGEEFAYRMVPVLTKTAQNGTRHIRRIPIKAVLIVKPGKNGPFGATKNPQTSIRAPMSIPIQGPNKYPPAAIGRPVSVISVTVERGIRKKDRTTPNAIRMELVVSRRRLIFEVLMETSPDLCLFGSETGITLC